MVVHGSWTSEKVSAVVPPTASHLLHLFDSVRMTSLSSIQRETVAALTHIRALPASGTVRGNGSGITFDFADAAGALQILRNRERFAQGRLGILHSRAVGGVLTEYRSYRRGERYSLHIVIGKTGRVFADLDRFNPYQNPLELLKHGILELMPHLLRLAFGRTRSSQA
jgi:hypothetical protein